MATRATNTEKEGVSLGLSEDTADSRNVFAGIQEQNKFHGNFSEAVIVFEVFFDFPLHCGMVVYDCVGSVVTVYTEEEIAKDDSVAFEDFILVEIEVLLGLIQKKI